jgi:glycosyltransferase involved in cell wall biosynthesis
MPQISVLMPVYNAERFLKEAIDSILWQTFTDFEFIIIDDCSTDSSPEILQSYTDPRIRLFRNEKNLGISATLNRGIELARAPLIARMDADDVSYPRRLQLQWEFACQHPDGALYACWAKEVDEDRQRLRMEHFNPKYYYYNQTFECWIYHPTMLFRKEAVQSIGGYTVPYSEDFNLIWELTRQHKMYVLPKFLLEYRITGQSLHQVVKKKEYDETFEQMVWRNLRYYLGEDFSLPAHQLEALRNNYRPLLEQQQPLAELRKALRYIDLYTDAINKAPNPNNMGKAINRQAAYYKKLYLVESFFRELPFKDVYPLLQHLISWQMLASAFSHKIQWRVRRIVKQIVA